jgi:antitoxin ParD1/3/4
MQHRKTISLTDKDDAFIVAQLDAGEYGNASEVVRAGLRLLEEHQLRLRELRALIDQGDLDIAAGRTSHAGKPGALANDIIARGKARSSHDKPA